MYDDEIMIKYQPVTGELIGLRKVEPSQAAKLENAYQNFVDNMAANGPDHIEMFELWDNNVQF